MKKWSLLLILSVLLVATVIPVSAAGNGPRSSVFTFVGNITAIGEDTVTVQVLGANKLAQPNVAQAFTMTVTDTTRYLLNDGTMVTPITFADLQVGDAVSVHGTLVNGVWTASRITVGAKLIHFP